MAWREDAASRGGEFVPPVFIVVCNNTAIAKAVFDWIRTESPMEMFRNDGENGEVTVQIDSSMMKKIDDGGESEGNAKMRDESKRLRFILDTAGKPEWPGGKAPDEWKDYVIRRNREIDESEDGDPSQRLSIDSRRGATSGASSRSRCSPRAGTRTT